MSYNLTVVKRLPPLCLPGFRACCALMCSTRHLSLGNGVYLRPVRAVPVDNISLFTGNRILPRFYRRGDNTVTRRGQHGALHSNRRPLRLSDVNDTRENTVLLPFIADRETFAAIRRLPNIGRLGPLVLWHSAHNHMFLKKILFRSRVWRFRRVLQFPRLLCLRRLCILRHIGNRYRLRYFLRPCFICIRLCNLILLCHGVGGG